MASFSSKILSGQSTVDNWYHHKMARLQQSTRRNALEKLAALSVQSSGDGQNDQDLEELCRLGTARAGTTQNGHINGDKQSQIAAIAMGPRELDALLALCKAAPLVQTVQHAERLLSHLMPYMSEAHKQTFQSTPLITTLPPWESLTFELTSAVLAIALNHPSLRSHVLLGIDQTIEALTNSAEASAWIGDDKNGSGEYDNVERYLSTIQLATSLLGFLDATAKFVQVWTPEQRLLIIQRLRYLLSEKFMISLEAALSALRTTRNHSRALKEWKRWTRQYAVKARPLGAMLLQRGFMTVVENTVVAILATHGALPSDTLLDQLIQRTPLVDLGDARPSDSMLQSLTDFIVEEMQLLDADADYLQVSSSFQQRLALDVKISSLRSFLCCSLLNPEIADIEVLMLWLDAITADTVQMADETLAQTVLKTMAVLSRASPSVAANLGRSLPRLIVQGKMTSETAVVAGECLAHVLKSLSQDVTISTLYTLGNLLSAGKNTDPSIIGSSPFMDGVVTLPNDLPSPSLEFGSTLAISSTSSEDSTPIYTAVIRAVVAIARACHKEQITALAISMLVQKIGRIDQVVDACIIVESASLALHGGVNELTALLRLYARVMGTANVQHNVIIVGAVNEARIRLANWIRKQSPLWEVYLTHLLALAVSSGDTAAEGVVDIALTTQTIAQLFRPMAILISSDPTFRPQFEDLETLSQLSRDAWFNIVVHGFTLSAQSTKTHAIEIQLLARYAFPLVDEARVDMPESGIELNQVLRRGEKQNLTEQRAALGAALPGLETQINNLKYPECVYLNTALLVSVLRARVGDCRGVLPYFLEHKVKTSHVGDVMQAIALHAVDTYVTRVVTGKEHSFAAAQVGTQLVTFFEGCCHRIAKVQNAAAAATDRIVSAIPSALCQKESLFALLELLTLMWRSCLDAETAEYELKPHYSSKRVNVHLTLSDDVNFRQNTLALFHRRCRTWVQRAIDVAPLDTKGLLQAYLEEFEDDGAYGHIDLGRSFAVEMGSAIPKSDQKLMSLDRQPFLAINTASDFIAQYTTRQEYRHKDEQLLDADDWTIIEHDGASRPLLEGPAGQAIAEALELRKLAIRLREGEEVAFDIVRDTLRKAASILTESTLGRTQLIHDLVSIPFKLFTKKAIELGISIWLSVAKELPSLESRILVEVAAGWEESVYLRKGFFMDSYKHLDPFFIKEEFAPSNWAAIKKRQQATHDLIAPHLRLAQFLSSQLNASRLTSPFVQRVYERLIHLTMKRMRYGVNQPLAREVHFHIILLALQVLRYNTRLETSSQWRMKDSILSGALQWFVYAPRWSFGSNKLQVKAEIKLLDDVFVVLTALSSIGSKTMGPLLSLTTKQELLMQLLAQEATRLSVWSNPTNAELTSMASVVQYGLDVKDSTIVPYIGIAWEESPSIAIQLVARYPESKVIASEVRTLLLAQPEKALYDSDALYILLGESLPADVKTQLKYLLYWAPLNPMAAVTYFMPAYGNHPLILQYALRALESHSVDVTFFYVPQIVQALRYDALGYVERYIVETAKFSQLFAHQIIWNMKANAYKDDNSEIEDSIKPALDKVEDAMLSSWGEEDKSFYRREFDFFDKVTGISGTLKPLIKAPKPEKKQKIEEELRKIEIEVGVYLPSNPDGVVIGIDRKSGKPLQSHAKAPFMATFRIRKEEIDNDAVAQQGTAESSLVKRRTYEVWQSAIFKVGDDCRQDILALQLVAAFRGIFNSVGLDVYVFPYRVTATAPGCGVIDVLPNSISRDMLGREAVNGLYEYFISKYGYEDSIRFQEARSNFIKSMAAYSIISYLLQFKDRHNGNIMVDDAGHILHIDFGFCFDIAPGGVKFERAPFKLTPEMVAVMGGSTSSPSFKAFEELCVKVFLASRQYVEQLSHIVATMLDSGLPCFKPTTIQHFKERFVLQKDDREAAEFVRKLVHWSAGSYSTGVYDYYQLLTNGIPY